MKAILISGFIAVLALGTLVQEGTGATLLTSFQAGQESYQAFTPSKIIKQKRVLKQRVPLWGWGVLALTAALIGVLVWLVLLLWPAVGLGWRIAMLFVG